MVRHVGAAFLVFSTFASAQEPRPAPHRPRLSEFGAAKARTLMRQRLPCAGCHVVDARGGGRVGPDLSRVAERRPPEYVRRMIEDPQRAAPGTVMPRVPMATATRELIIAYLTGTHPAAAGSDSGATAPALEPAPRGGVPRSVERLYGLYCAACHGARGRGDGPNARYLPVPPARHADAEFMSRRTDDRLFDAIYAGGYPLGRSVAMPPYGATLTRAEIWALVRHLRQLCRCSPPPWSTDADRAQASARQR